MKLRTLLIVMSMAVPNVASLVGCAEHQQVQERTGQLSMPLSVTTSTGNEYRLQNASLFLTGTESQTVNADPIEATISVNLAVGNYVAALQPGWVLESRPAGGVFAPVDATLASLNPQAFEISELGTTQVVYDFLTNDGTISLGRGTLQVAMNVTEATPANLMRLSFTGTVDSVSGFGTNGTLPVAVGAGISGVLTYNTDQTAMTGASDNTAIYSFGSGQGTFQLDALFGTVGVKSASAQSSAVIVYNNYSYAGTATDGFWWQSNMPQVVSVPDDNTQFNMTLRTQTHLSSVSSVLLPSSAPVVPDFEFQNLVSINSHARRSDCGPSDDEPSCDLYYEIVGHITATARIF